MGSDYLKMVRIEFNKKDRAKQYLNSSFVIRHFRLVRIGSVGVKSKPGPRDSDLYFWLPMYYG